MGNQCCQNQTHSAPELQDNQIDAHLEDQKKLKNHKREVGVVGAAYQDQLLQDRKEIIRSKQARNESDRLKLQSLRSNLSNFQATA